jgi:hypothetical protein
VDCSAADSRGNIGTGAFPVNVVNRPPVANADTAQSTGGAVQITVLANDSDVDGGTLSVTVVGAPAHGAAVLGAPDVVTYTPASGFTGSDTFTYTISDGQGGTATGVVTVTVTAAASPDGLMFGAGHIDSGSTHHHFQFIVTRIGDRKFGRVKYWVKAADGCDDDDDNDDGRRWDSYDNHDRDGNRRRPTIQFDGTSVANVVFSDDPAFEPAGRNAPDNDTVRFSGPGKLNGSSRYTFEVLATDQGEPGRGRDTFSIVIKDRNGAVAANAAGRLKSGNIQSVDVGDDRNR